MTTRRWIAGRAPVALLTLGSCLSVLAAPRPAVAQEPAGTLNDELATGRVHYIASCARCHGVDGDGGEGPPIARTRLTRAPTDDDLLRIMRSGISGTAMSGARWLSDGELALVARYVRSLAPSGQDEVAALPGDPAQGRAVFEAQGCDVCHTIGGFGTARGPDLTTVGARRAASHVRQSLVDPGAAQPRGMTALPRAFVDYLVVRVVDGQGRVVRGMRMNEDTYTIQLKDAAGVIHSFYKPGLRELEREFDQSLMQSYADVLSDEELDDLVAYLMTLRGQRLRSIS